MNTKFVEFMNYSISSVVLLAKSIVCVLNVSRKVLIETMTSRITILPWIS